MLNITNLSTLPITVTAAVTLSPPSLQQLPPVPQQPNHVVCHVILWLVGVVPFSTNRKGSSIVFFFCLQTLPACGHFHERSPFWPFFLHQMHSKHYGNVCEKAWWTLFIISPVLIGLLTQFKNWYIVWRPHQHKRQNSWETHGGCVLLLHHLKLVTWFGRTGTPVDSGGGAWGWALQWLALVRMWLWCVWCLELAIRI